MLRGLPIHHMTALLIADTKFITIMKPLFFLIALLLISCSREIIKTEVDVIPQPASVEVYEGECVVAGATFKVDDRFDEIASAAVADFEAAVEAASGTVSGSSKTAVVFKYDRRSGKEAYSISIAENRITVKASSSNGVLYAIQTLKQIAACGNLYPVLLLLTKSGHCHWRRLRTARGLHIEVCIWMWPVIFSIWTR